MRTFKNAEKAYYIARREGPKDDTRQACLSAPYWAYFYAHDVDKCPRNDTRQVALSNPYRAYLYALNVDKKLRNDTRQAVQNSTWLIPYLRYVSKLTMIP